MTQKPANQDSDAQARPAKPYRLGKAIRAAVSIGLIAASIGVFVAVGQSRPPTAGPPSNSGKLAVEVETVLQHDGGIDFDVDGAVIPFRQINVPAEVAGRVSFKSENCRIGHMVEKGELLMRIDPQDYQLELRRLEQNLKQAQASLNELKVQTAAARRQIELSREDLTIKKREVQRYEAIDDPGVYSQSELDSARLNELQARDALQTEIDQLALLEAQHERLTSACELVAAQVAKARVDLGRCEIHSPITGVVTSEPVEQGNYLQRGGTAVVVQDTSLMEIRASLLMHQVQWLWQSAAPATAGGPQRGYQLPETPVTVTFDAGSTRYAWSGKLSYLDGAQVDKQTRMIPCRVLVDDPSQVRIEGRNGQPDVSAARSRVALMAGMYVTVRVHAAPAVGLLRLSDAAMQPGNEVWTVRAAPTGDGSECLHKASIRVAHAAGEMVLAYAEGSDLRAGDRIVISPLAAPMEGTPVEVVARQ